MLIMLDAAEKHLVFVREFSNQLHHLFEQLGAAVGQIFLFPGIIF